MKRIFIISIVLLAQAVTATEAKFSNPQEPLLSKEQKAALKHACASGESKVNTKKCLVLKKYPTGYNRIALMGEVVAPYTDTSLTPLETVKKWHTNNAHLRALLAAATEQKRDDYSQAATMKFGNTNIKTAVATWDGMQFAVVDITQDASTTLLYRLRHQAGLR